MSLILGKRVPFQTIINDFEKNGLHLSPLSKMKLETCRKRDLI